MGDWIQRIYEGVLNGDQELVRDQVDAGLQAGVPADSILNAGMVAAMKEVGRLFAEGEYFVPEMLISARAMQTGMAMLKPHLVRTAVKGAGTIVIGTVQGDLHTIGKNLVAIMLECAAFEIVDLGFDVSPESFVEAVRAHQPDVIGLSALLTTTMPSMQATIEALKTAGLRDRVKVIVGGAPLTDAYARAIGADGYAPDASRAVALTQSLITG